MDHLTIHLGVIDLPYAAAPGRRSRSRSVTTGDVAEWLETKYHPIEVFWLEKETDNLADLESGIEATMESILSGAPLSLDPFGSGCSKIEDRFKQFLASKEIEGLGIPGVPTQAALTGVSHRRKRPYVRRAPRPSFIDTGLYQSSFKAWVD